MGNNMNLPVQTGYTIKNDTYIKTISKGNRDFDIEIGDSKQINVFEPQLKFNTFTNLSNVSMRYQTKLIGSDNKHKLGKNSKKGKDTLLYDLGDEVVEFFETEDGVEINIVLASKPKSNVFTFSLNYKDVTFHKQPDYSLLSPTERAKYPDDITQEEKCKGCYVIMTAVSPDSVPVHIFRYGQIGTIFRPLITDAEGKTCWGELDINEEGTELTVTVPQVFLNRAKYPVVVDPEIGLSDTTGYGETGISAATIQVIDNNAARHYTAGSNEQIQNYNIYARTTIAPATAGTITLAAYDMGVSSNDPEGSSLVSQATINPTNTAFQWLTTSDVNTALTSTHNYTMSLGHLTNPDVGLMKGAIITLTGAQLLRSANTGALLTNFTQNATDTYSFMFCMYASVGTPPAAPVFSGTIPNSSFARTSNVSIATASYFTDPETFTLNNAPAFLGINSSTGVITNTGANVTGVYSGITVTCTNAQGSDTSNTFQVTITAQVPTLTFSFTNKTGNVGLTITPTDASVYFTGADTYSATGLPAGLSIDTNTGIISGTPTTQFNYTGIYITATNVDGSTNSNTFSWNITAALPIPTITPTTINLRRGENYTIIGTNFGATQGAGTVKLVNTNLTIISWSNTSITVQAPTGGFYYGTNYAIYVINNDGYNSGATSNPSTYFNPVTGFNYITLAANYAQLPSNSIFYQKGGEYVNLVVGDQVDYEVAASPEGTVEMTNLAVASITGATSSGTYTFDHGVLQASSGVYSPSGAATVTLTSTTTDTKAPDWVSLPDVPTTLITNTTATVTASIDEPGNIYVVAVLSTAPTPSSEQIKAGVDFYNITAPKITSLATTSINAVITGLTAGVSYKFCFTAEDDEPTPNLKGSPTVVTRSTIPILDSVPPEFVTKSVTQVTKNSCLLTATIDDDTATIYWGLTAGSVVGLTASDIINGYYINDIGEQETVLQKGSGSTFNQFLISGLSTSTNYAIFLTAQDPAGNLQETVPKISFKTSAATAIRSVTDTFVDPNTGNPLANTTLEYQLQGLWASNPTDSGTLTTDANGNFTITNLNTGVGTAYLTTKLSDDTKGSPPHLVTVTEV